ncbi:alpha/beta fold hydrolase [Streptomyces sp. NPDC055059]|jgi:pimeloyl-ACP methyl ester carboxylesterase|uniref:alpha/beta fold hydrolase n=1 Tax=Streptomyces sp. NPDC127172 TaxID=3345382 RepID=UPI00363C2708
MSQASGNGDSDDQTNAKLPRRHVLRTAGAGALGLGLGGVALTAVTLRGGAPQPQATSLPTPEALGSVGQAPHLSAGFTKTFTDRFVQANGIRQHVVVGGEGPPLLLIHGWPETWYAWRLVMPALARHFTVIAVDQRGIGLTDNPKSGYDTRTLARDMVTLMDALGYQRFAVVGHDTGMPIAYALAADHPERVARLAVAEAFLPAVTPLPPLVGTAQANNRLWHIPFNRLTDVNEQLVRGRENIYFGWQFATKAVRKLPDYAVDYYVRILASHHDALRGSFGWYRALDTTSAQDQQRKKSPLTLPVLAIGGAGSLGESVAGTMKRVARDVRSRVIPGTGHWVAEEAPQEVLAALTTFLAPYRDQARSTQPRATATLGI